MSVFSSPDRVDGIIRLWSLRVNMSPFLTRFQDDFVEAYLAQRTIKAQKVLAILEREFGSLKCAKLLDVGCGNGEMTRVFARRVALVVGADLDEFPQASVPYVRSDACRLPFADDAYDVVVLHHVIEHVSDQPALLDEVWRVLRPEGLCYFGCPNRYSLMEPHYRIPLLSWLPRPCASWIVRICRRGNGYPDHCPSYFELKRLFHKFEVKDYSVAILKNSQQFAVADRALQLRSHLTRWIPGPALRCLLPLFPSWVFILKKSRTAATV
jgi:SAM-dependent methyltransferase